MLDKASGLLFIHKRGLFYRCMFVNYSCEHFLAAAVASVKGHTTQVPEEILLVKIFVTSILNFQRLEPLIMYSHNSKYHFVTVTDNHVYCTALHETFLICKNYINRGGTIYRVTCGIFNQIFETKHVKTSDNLLIPRALSFSVFIFMSPMSTIFSYFRMAFSKHLYSSEKKVDKFCLGGPVQRKYYLFPFRNYKLETNYFPYDRF